MWVTMYRNICMYILCTVHVGNHVPKYMYIRLNFKYVLYLIIKVTSQPSFRGNECRVPIKINHKDGKLLYQLLCMCCMSVKSNKTCSDCRNTGQKKIFLNDILSRKENVILQIKNQERRNNKYSILHVAEVEY